MQGKKKQRFFGPNPEKTTQPRDDHFDDEAAGDGDHEDDDCYD